MLAGEDEDGNGDEGGEVEEPSAPPPKPAAKKSKAKKVSSRTHMHSFVALCWSPYW